MKDIHSLINELGASINEDDKYEAMMILNHLYLSGYSDLFICIALIKVLERKDFNRNRFLFSYEPFIDEVNNLKDKFIKTKSSIKDSELCAFYGSFSANDTDIALIDEYNELYNNSDDEEVIQNYLDYLYMKYCFALEVLNNNIGNYKKIFRETNDPGFWNFAMY